MYYSLHHEKPLELTKKDGCPLYKAKWSRSGVDLVHQSTKRKHPWQPATSKKSPSQISLPRERHGVAAVVRVRAHHAGRRAKPYTLNAPRRHTGTADRAPTAIATRSVWAWMGVGVLGFAESTNSYTVESRWSGVTLTPLFQGGPPPALSSSSRLYFTTV